MSKCRLFAGAVVLLASLNVYGGDFDDIYASLFLGQAYPSGHVYVHPFSNQTTLAQRYPETLTYVRVVQQEGLELVHRGATHLHVLKHDPKNSVFFDSYIPGIEGMSEVMSFCGKNVNYVKNPEYHLIAGEDLYAVWGDDCYEFTTLGLYLSENKDQYSYMVLAHDARIELSGVSLLSPATQRPMTKLEQQEAGIEREKVQVLENDGECTTENKTLADARVFMQASIVGVPLFIRLSWFDDPGCMGHFATNYVVDILNDENVLLDSRHFYVVRGVL